MSFGFNGSSVSSSTGYIQELKGHSIDLKTTAMREGKAVCEELSKHIKDLETADNLERPKTLLGRFFTPMQHEKEIDAEKLLLNDITVLQKKLDKTEDITQIDKLTQKILDKIKKLSPDNSHASILSTKIDVVRVHYQTNMPVLLSTLGSRVGAISQSTHPNSIGVIKSNTTIKKITKLIKINKEKGGINLPILPVLKTFTSADEVNKELVKMEKIHAILTYPQTAIKEVNDSAETLKNLIGSFRAPTSHFFNPFKEEITAKLDAIKEFNIPFPQLTLKQATKIAKINEDLIKLKEDYIQFTTDYQAAAAAYQKLNGEAYAVSYQAITNALSDIPPIENDVFSENIAKRNLEKIKAVLDSRKSEILDNYLKQIGKAKSPSDFKKIAERCNQLVAYTTAAEKVGTALKKAIAAHSTVWISKTTGENGFFNTNELTEVNPSKVKLMKLFNKKTASLKDLAKKDLNIYIATLTEMTTDLEKLSEENFNKLEKYESEFQSKLENMSKSLKNEKRIINEGHALQQSLDAYDQKREMFSMIVSAKTKMDKDVAGFSWEKHLKKFEKIQEGFDLISPSPKLEDMADEFDLNSENITDEFDFKSLSAPSWEQRFSQWKKEMLEI